MLILGISGSLRSGSTNSTLLSVAQDCAPPEMEFVIANVLAELPHFSPDIDIESVASVSRWAAQVKAADGIVVSTPEYARGYPGSLKNALDWLVQTDAYIDKPFMLLNASGRSRVAQRTLTTVLETMSGIHVESASTTIALLGKFMSREDILANKPYMAQIETALARFAREVARLKSANNADAL